MSMATQPTYYLAVPAGDEYAPIRTVVSDACEAHGVERVGSDDPAESGYVSSKVIDLIEQANMVIADISGLTPAVLLSAGMALALRKRLLLVSLKVPESPSDLASHRVIHYEPHDTEKLEHYLEFWIKESLVA